LVIDDDACVGRVLSLMLKAEGYEVEFVQSGMEAVERLRHQRFDLAITDLVMPEMDGLHTLAALKELDPGMEVIVMTGYAAVEPAVAALKQGACNFLAKPLTLEQLRLAVTQALEKRRLNAAVSLHQACRPLFETLDRQELIPSVLNLAQSTLGASGAGLALISPEATGLRVDLSGDHGVLGEAAVRSLAQEAMQSHEILRGPSSEGGHFLDAHAPIPAGSVLVYPLEIPHVTLGALVLLRRAGEAPFTPFEVERGKILAGEIAVALENSTLYRELSRKAEDLAAVQGQVV
jgi:CheY-like chemotaxis protein